MTVAKYNNLFAVQAVEGSILFVAFRILFWLFFEHTPSNTGCIQTNKNT